VTTRITTESAKSILRVMLANAVARTVMGTITALEEMEAPLTEIQQVEIVATAMMDYRSVAEDAEESVEMEVVMDKARASAHAVKHKVEPVWASDEERLDYYRRIWEN
jgi:hypothetical protein